MHTDGIIQFLIKKDMSILVTVGNDKIIKVWDWRKSEEKFRFESDFNFNSIVFSPNEMILFAASED